LGVGNAVKLLSKSNKAIKTIMKPKIDKIKPGICKKAATLKRNFVGKRKRKNKKNCVPTNQ
jgi:hypothetical protein